MRKKERKFIDCIPILILMGILVIFAMTFNLAISNDESFSLNIIKGSFVDLTIATAQDVHPPLYYYILKVFIDLFSFLPINEIVLAKWVSVLPSLFLLFFAKKKMEPVLGKTVCTLFCFFLIFMPKMMLYAVEIRMYSFAMMFVFLSSWYLYMILLKNKRIDWILYSVFVLCASYTHYFSCLAVGIIHVMLLIYIVWKKREMIKSWFISSIIIVLAYLPWFFVLLWQILSKGHLEKHTAWIEPITIKRVIGYYSFMTTPSYNDIADMACCGFLSILFLGIAICTIKEIKSKNSIEYNFLIITGFGTPVFVIAIGTIVSLILSPIFSARYLFVALGTFWLAVAMGIPKLLEINEKKKGLLEKILFCIFLLVTLYSTTCFVYFEGML